MILHIYSIQTEWVNSGGKVRVKMCVYACVQIWYRSQWQQIFTFSIQKAFPIFKSFSSSSTDNSISMFLYLHIFLFLIFFPFYAYCGEYSLREILLLDTPKKGMLGWWLIYVILVWNSIIIYILKTLTQYLELISK